MLLNLLSLVHRIPSGVVHLTRLAGRCCIPHSIVAFALLAMVGASTAEAARALNPAASSTPTQDSVGLELTVGAPFAVWRASPGTVIEAELLRFGERRALTRGTASDDTGEVWLGFFGAEGQEDVLPGDVIVISTVAADTEEIARVGVPLLKADVDAQTNIVLGRAPKGANLRLELWRHGASAGAEPTLNRAISADDAGNVAVNLEAADIAPGDAGRLTLTDDDGNRFHARFTALLLELRLGGQSAVAYATLGTTLTLQSAGPEGDPRLDVAVRVMGGFPGGPPADRVGLSQYGEEEQVLRPGDQIVFGQLGGLKDPFSTTLVLPPLTVELPGADRIAGQGPASAMLDIQLRGPRGERLTTTVETDETGSYDLTVDHRIGAGWRAVVSWLNGPVRVLKIGAVPQVQVGVHTASVRGVNQPRTPVTVTLRTGGNIAGEWSTIAGDEGSWFIQLGQEGSDDQDGPLHRVRRGDVLEVDLAGGDPVTLIVPELTAMTDPDMETVSGNAPPGSRLLVTIDGGLDPEDQYGIPDELGPLATMAIDVGPDGRYLADWDGKLDRVGNPIDIEPPVFGTVVLPRDDGHEFLLRWAPLTIQVRLDYGFISGTGPGARQVTAELFSAEGDLVATNSMDDWDDPGLDATWWYAALTDPIGQFVTPRPGDRLQVQVGDDLAEVIVPPLEGVVHVADDLVTGNGAPGAVLDLVAFSDRGMPHREQGVVEEDGTFRFDLGAAGLDILYNWSVEVSMDLGRHEAARGIRAPGISVDLASGYVYGAAEPGRAATLDLLRDGRLLTQIAFIGSPQAAFYSRFETPDQRVIVPRAGDEIVLRVPEATSGETEVRMRVPRFTLDYQVGQSMLTGTIEPDARLEVYVGSVFPVGEPDDVGGEATIDTHGDGRWSGEFDNPEFEVAPGTQFHAQIQLASGHTAFSNIVVPVLRVHAGGAAVCGWAVPGGTITAQLMRDTTEVADASGVSNVNGHFSLALTGPDGQPVIIAPGNTIRAELGQGPATLAVPTEPLSVAVDWDAWRVTGSGPPETPLVVMVPGRGCSSPDNNYGYFGPSITARTDSDGRFDVEIPLWFRDFIAAVGRGVEATFTGTDGHRYFVVSAPLRVEVHVGLSRVEGRTTPLEPVELKLLDEHGEQRASATVMADPFGFFKANLVNAANAEVASRGGDRLMLRRNGAEDIIEILPLSFDFNANTGLAGLTAPGQEVRLILGLQQQSAILGRTVHATITADDRGRFEIAQPPPRSAWRFDDVRSIRLEIPRDGGHVLVSELDLGVPPDSTPRIFLPWGMR